MARFLNTSATNFFLEEMVKTTQERLIFISPYLKLNDRLKELLEDKNRLKIDIRIVYGKSELRPTEAEWLAELNFVRTSFCKNLHAKCYINENKCIITSLNLYEFSQVNNNEMGILVDKTDDTELYRDAYDEALRIIRISDEDVALVEQAQSKTPPTKAAPKQGPSKPAPKPANTPIPSSGKEQAAAKPESQESKSVPYSKLTLTRLAQSLSITRVELTSQLEKKGYIKINGDEILITALGFAQGGEAKAGRHGSFTLWPPTIEL
ncbi:phospholipase D family protein [Halomonas sp. KO116]|uniref:phospholipase D family protein n=1 Tax=Halomonas sp. KO116 TaxID=1504981 RepID=UPI0004E31292|nr:phospholipase D family protein [Halomonas sp. KO116]AJY53322.1 Phospholipase D-like domain containing protein [Halomonas sp. KO116]